MNKTSIEWTDYSSNLIKYRDPDGKVVHGCVKVSPGCANCYASAISKRFSGGEFMASRQKTLTPFFDEAEAQHILRSEATGAHRGMPDTLNAAAGLWATPAAHATKGAYSPGALTRRDGKSRMDLLDNQAVYFQPFRPAASTPSDGGRSSASTRTSRRRLNPDFAEWLMGWPIGWTVPGSPLPETEWSRWWRHMRGSLYELGWR